MTPVTHSVTVRCPVEHAFHVFTSAVDAWWPPSHRRLAGGRLQLDGGPDGRLVEQGPDGTTLELGRITAWEPPFRLAFAWRLGAPPDAPTSVQIRFTAHADTTRVEVLHEDGPKPLPDWTRTAVIFDRAWKSVLTSLQQHLERP